MQYESREATWRLKTEIREVRKVKKGRENEQKEEFVGSRVQMKTEAAVSQSSDFIYLMVFSNQTIKAKAYHTLLFVLNFIKRLFILETVCREDALML